MTNKIPQKFIPKFPSKAKFYQLPQGFELALGKAQVMISPHDHWPRIIILFARTQGHLADKTARLPPGLRVCWYRYQIILI